MGCGSWDKDTYTAYSSSVGRDVGVDGTLIGNYSAQDMFVQIGMSEELNPYKKIRECCDNEEHPNTKPVILGLDVTGSMGGASVRIAKELNTIMTNLYENVKDVEFMIMGIGDLKYDRCPIQASQFESDIRIAEQLDKVYFERGGGGNGYESYTAAWYFGLKKCKLDCWKRGEKGLIITIGDEKLNPYLPKIELDASIYDNSEKDIETNELYKEASEKYDIYHLCVNENDTCYRFYKDGIDRTWGKLLDKDHLKVVNYDSLSMTIVDIVTKSFSGSKDNEYEKESGMISW